MKKLTVMLVVLATLAMLSVNCFAADVSTAMSDLELLFFEDFSDATKADYEATDYYLAEVVDDALFIQTLTGKNDFMPYIFPGSPELSGLSKMTVAYRFKYDVVDHNRELGIAFGGKETDKFYFAGFNLSTQFVEGEGRGVKTYFAPINDNKARCEGKLTRRWQYHGLDPEMNTYYEYNGEQWYTLIIELEKGKDPTFIFYTEDQRIQEFPGVLHGGGSLPDGSDYLFSTDPDFNFDGFIGLCRNGLGMYVDGVAFYGTTGLPYDELVAKVASEGVSAPAETEAPATEAPAVTDAPATDAPPVTDAPATDAPAVTDAPATDAPVEVTDAPATDAPATDAPATDAPKDDKGCGGVIGIGAIVAVLGCAVVLKKREN